MLNHDPVQIHIGLYLTSKFRVKAEDFVVVYLKGSGCLSRILISILYNLALIFLSKHLSIESISTKSVYLEYLANATNNYQLIIIIIIISHYLVLTCFALISWQILLLFVLPPVGHFFFKYASSSYLAKSSR